MGSGGHNRRTSRELAASATARDDRALGGGVGAGREHLTELLDAWVGVARVAVRELEASGEVSVVNAGDQLQKHPSVTVLEAASKRVETLVVLLDRFGDADVGDGGGDGAPPRTWQPEVVES